MKLNQCGGRVGGPIVFPALYDGPGKAFYFFHYEQLRFPNSFTRTRKVLHPEASRACSVTTSAAQTRRVNLLQLAAANGQIATIDPTVIDAARTTSGATRRPGVSSTTDPLHTATSGRARASCSNISRRSDRLQPRRRAPPERIGPGHLGRARSRLPERRRRAVPRRAELPAVQLDPSAVLAGAALDAVAEPGQRGPRRHHRARRLVELRRPTSNGAQTFDRHRRLCDRPDSNIGRPTGARPTARAGAARRRSASRRTDLAEGLPQHQLRRVDSALARVGDGQNRVPGITWDSTPRLIRRSGCSTRPTSPTRRTTAE